MKELKGYAIDVSNFPEDKKKKVQDAFFKLGIKWKGLENDEYHQLNRDIYTNINCGGLITNGLMWSHFMDELDKLHEVSYEELLKDAGMLEEEEKERIQAKYSNDIYYRAYRDDQSTDKNFYIQLSSKSRSLEGLCIDTEHMMVNSVNTDHYIIVDQTGLQVEGTKVYKGCITD